MTIDADSLIVRDGAQIATSTFGQGNAGELRVRAGQIELMGTDASIQFPSGLFTSTSSTGDGGLLTIDADSLIVRDRATLTTDTFGEGKAGNIRIRARQIELLRFSNFFTSSQGEALAGTIILEAENILLDTSMLSAATEAGSQGAIELFVSDSLTLRNSSAILTLTINGVGGNLTIRADEVTLDNNSFLNTFSALEGGSPGSLNITANQLRLNNSILIADTGIGVLIADTVNTIENARGNINLNTSIIILENNSQIRTESIGENATGGNITINTDILAAVEDSDISANAPEGAGGNIEIIADNIFGAEFRPGVLDTPFSDITATGATTANQGTVQLNTPEVDTDFSAVELPDVPIDAASLIGQDFCSQGKNSEFIITGRGGIPSAPTDLLPGVALWEDLRPPVASRETPSSEPSAKSENQPRRLVEALGWYRNSEGVVMLTANPTQVTSHNVGVGLAPHPGCNVNQW